MAAAIQEQNTQFAPGRLGNTPSPEGTLLTWQLDAQGRLPEVKDFENIIVKTGENSSRVLIKDIARVELGGLDYSVDGRYNNMRSVAGGTWLLPGANAIATGQTGRAEEEPSRRHGTARHG